MTAVCTSGPPDYRPALGLAGRVSGRCFRNPVLPGSYPDPSVCRVGGDFYLVNSSFEFFPGIPVHHSRDLVHWRLIGHVVAHPGDLDLGGVRRWSGIWAPTIRHHRGRFFVVWTDMRGVGEQQRPPPANFVAVATDPAGPWSAPLRLDDQRGFDPSLFFAEDGSAWYSATYGGGSGRRGHFLRRFDPDGLCLVSAMCTAWIEGPNLIQESGTYTWTVRQAASPGPFEYRWSSGETTQTITRDVVVYPGMLEYAFDLNVLVSDTRSGRTRTDRKTVVVRYPYNCPTCY